MVLREIYSNTPEKYMFLGKGNLLFNIQIKIVFENSIVGNEENCFDIVIVFTFTNSQPLIRQKGKSQNGCYKETKYTKFSEKHTFLPSDTHACACVSVGKKCLFFGKFGVLCFLVTPDLRFILLPYCQQNFQKH